MSRKKMRKSNVAMLSLLGLFALVVVMFVGFARITYSRMTSGEYSDYDDFGSVGFSDLTTREFDLRDFKSVKIYGSGDIELEQGDDWLVEVTYPRGIEDRLKVEVDGDELVINPGRFGGQNWGSGWDWWRNHDNKMTARIVMPELETLDIAGASNLEFNGFSGDKLIIITAGASNIEGDGGDYQELTLTMSGAGNVDMRDMSFVDANVIISGAGNVQLEMAGGVLSGVLSGFCNVEYYGKVSDERVKISGFGKVTQK